jgi:CHAT domain-containing protein/lipopolysaccharide biosynthesis regulator YciM
LSLALPISGQRPVQEIRTATAQDRELQEAQSLTAELNRLNAAGKWDEALELAKRALDIRERILGPEHAEVAESLHNLAAVYRAKSDYTNAESAFQRALSIREKVLGQEHRETTRSLLALSDVYQAAGAYAKAATSLERALAIQEKILGAEHQDLARTLTNLAIVYNYTGNFVKAEPLHLRSLSILEKTLGPEHPSFATAMHNLANVYASKGDFKKAQPLYQKALAIREKVLDPQHRDLAFSLSRLAILYRETGEFAKAESLYLRAQPIFEKAFGPEHRETGFNLNSLAGLYETAGDLAKAEPLYRRALEIWQKALGGDHVNVGVASSNLARLYRKTGDYSKAESFDARALTILETALGPDDPNLADALSDRSLLYRAKGDIAMAVSYQSRANNISARNVAMNVAGGSEREKVVYLNTFTDRTNQTVSLHVLGAPDDPAALRLAATMVFQRKGQVLDEMTNSLEAVRRRLSPQDRALLEEWAQARSRLASLSLSGPGTTDRVQFRGQLEREEERIEKLESEISSRSMEFRAQTQPVSLGLIQSTIPSDAVLVEFFSYLPVDAKTGKSGSSRYVAYAFAHDGPPAWVDLGDAQEIDDLARAFRESLSNRRRDDVRQRARSLDDRLMRPVRKLLGKTEHILLSPAAALNLIPFGALVDEQGRYLIENYVFTYLTSGRDLLRLEVHTAGKQSPVVIGNPLFGVERSARVLTDSGNNRRSMDFVEDDFAPLPGTAREAQDIAALLPGAIVWTGSRATEHALKQIAGPTILHIATHGFFLPDQGTKESLEDPSLRSGLILAGANQRQGGPGEDGVLTALEVAGLDLWGTKLVVLSACDTGVGETTNSEGVYGLRRALVLAGAESHVMSLWQVADQTTRELMVGFYKELQRGARRSEALRTVQLRLLRNGNRRHPFYWAPFIHSGEWANLDGRR